MNKNRFDTYYHTLAESQLLHIIEHADDYEKGAAVAAQVELELRWFSDPEFVALEREQARQREIAKIEAERHWLTRMKKAFVSFRELMHPMRYKTPKQSVQMVVVAWGILTLLNIPRAIYHLQFVWYDYQEFGFHYSHLFIFVWLLIMVTSWILMWRRISVGWFMAMLLLGIEWTDQLMDLFITVAIYAGGTGEGLSSLFMSISGSGSWWQPILLLVLYSYLLFTLFKRRVTEDWFGLGRMTIKVLTWVLSILVFTPFFVELFSWLSFYDGP